MGSHSFQGAYPDPVESQCGQLYQGIFEELSNDPVRREEIGRLGTIRRVGSRSFVYAKAGAVGLAQGKIMVQPTPAANHQNIAVASAVAVGDKTITVTLGATLASLNQYEDGFITISDATGEGTTYGIRSHPAADASASLTLTLYDSVHEALTTSSEVCLTPNPYNGVIINPAANPTVAIPAGTPLNGVTALYYCWLQTWGVGAALADEAVVVGKDLTLGISTDGAVELADASGEVILGRTIMALVDEEYRPIYYTIQR